MFLQQPQTDALLTPPTWLAFVRYFLKVVFPPKKIDSIALVFCVAGMTAFSGEPDRVALREHVPRVVAGLTPLGQLPATNRLQLAIGLPLRNQTQLDELLSQLYDSASTNYHRFLTSPEFTARFGPTEKEYQAVKAFARSHGFVIAGTQSNRLVLDVQADAGNVEQAFHVTLRKFRHPSEARDFFAPDTEPSVPTNLPVADMWGLSDYGRAKPQSHKLDPLQIRPLGGSGPGGYYAGNDFRNAYAPGTTLDGAGQSVGLLEFSSYFSTDITSYENTIGLTNYVPVNNVVLPGGTPGTANNSEVALDIEVAIAMAPALSQVIVYEIKSINPSSIVSRMASDNLAKQLSSSWTWSGGPSTTVENAFKQMAAQGQSFFQASGDSDAYTGAQILDNSLQVNSPVGSTNITAVGGTTLTMSGTGNSWSSETVWNYHIYGGANANVGSGGGISSYYKTPSWQSGLDMSSNLGSSVWRNVPDVALTADGVYVAYNNGGSGGMAGTSCAAPLWAGFCALANQFSVATNGTTLGFLNPAFYAIASSSCYANCFHDITTGNNVGTNTAGLFNALAGYDLCTGLGTPGGTNLITALVWPPPIFLAQPVGRNVTNGVSVAISATVGGTPPFAYVWLFNGTNLSDGGNISGSASNVLSITSATTNNLGSYQLVVTNATGINTSSVAVLNVGIAPVVVTQPTNLTILAGGSAIFSSGVAGSTPLVYQWRKNGTNLSNGTGISGVTNNLLTLTAVTTNSTGSYSLFTTNLFGVVTSSVASLTVVLPPSLVTSTLTNRTLECGRNTNSFSFTTVGTPPLAIQWSFDSVAVTGATNNSFALTNLNLPSHTVSVTVTNLYGSVTSNALLTVRDTLVPVITLLGPNPLMNELGSTFTDPGATASDTCAGAVAVAVSGSVNPGLVGTNTLTYTASDGNGNVKTNTRSVIVRDTTPPAIAWSFTNLVLVADNNCSARMPNVTGTNYLLATDLSGALTILQSPTNNAVLFLGTNPVVITVKDASGNAANSTNKIIVRDQTPPVITLNGGNPLFCELGYAFTNPGAIASDACAGTVAVVTSGSVNPNAIGTNTLTYTAGDSSGNTNTATRTVIVRDTMPPVISWSFTNLVLAADTNCSAVMPDVTGTNSILAADLSGPLTVSQSPPNILSLPLGTNEVVIAVADAFGNTAYSTNFVIVQDQTAPVFISQPPSQTNLVGATAVFSAAATACTPLAWQWYFISAPLAARTNSTLTLSNLTTAAAGNYFAIVTASGGSSTGAVATLTVNLRPTSLALSALINPSGFKQDLNFTAVVTPTNVAGSIQFLTNDVAFDVEPLVGGQAGSTNTAALPRGTNFITAIYSGDANDLPSTNQLPQIVTNHPPSLSSVFYTRGAGTVLNIAVADLATNWSDPDGDPVSLAAIGLSTGGVTVTNDNGTLVYFNSNNVADQFLCDISDGFGGTNFQTVNLAVAFPAITAVAPSPDKSIHLNLTAAPGYTYVLEATTNIFPPGNWLPVATNTLGTNGVWSFIDASVTNFPQQFYRLRLLP